MNGNASAARRDGAVRRYLVPLREVSHPLENEEDVTAVLGILGKNDERAKAARRASRATEE